MHCPRSSEVLGKSADKIIFNIKARIVDERCIHLHQGGQLPAVNGIDIEIVYPIVNRDSFTFRHPLRKVCGVLCENAIPASVRIITSFARNFENEFMQMIVKKTKAEFEKSMRDNKREIEQAQERISKLDVIIQRLYEDNIEGKISDERFAKISTNYESEVEELKSRISGES